MIFHDFGDFNLHNTILYLINKKKNYTNMEDMKDQKIIKFNVAEVLENMQEDDLDFIIEEFEKYEKLRTNMVFDAEYINAFVNSSSHNNT